MIKKTETIKKLLLVFCSILVIIGIFSNAVFAEEERQVIIGFHKNVPSPDKIVKDNGGKVKRTFHYVDAVSANMSDINISKLKKDSRVAYIENDVTYHIADEYTASWGVQYIESQPVHNKGFTGAGVKIAVLDTGIYYNHEDLFNNYKGGIDIYNNDNDPYDDNCEILNCHGTHVSGIIAAERNNIGIVGVAPDADIYAVKVIGRSGGTSASYVTAGIEWAIANNMNIVTMSLECSIDPLLCDSQTLHNIIDVAYNDHNILIIGAAGNTGGGVAYPAIYDNVIAVSAIGQNGQLAGFSARGPKIELTAPGVNINSTICIVSGGTCVGSTYGLRFGTSMAAPYVTGVAALIMSNGFDDINNDGVYDNKDVRLILQQTARDIGIPGRDDYYGFGVVDAANALGVVVIPNPPPVITDYNPKTGFVSDIEGTSSTFNITADQIVDVKWYINGTQVDSDTGVVKSEYVNTSPKIGIWNVSAIATNANGSVMQSWTWNVAKSLTLKRLNKTPNDDIQNVLLTKGKYLVNIRNVDLDKMSMKVYYAETLVKKLSNDFEFSPKKNEYNINLDIQDATITFTPYGSKGAMAYVKITVI